jgi:DNA-directed RNA polymerase subunit omega
MARVTVEDCLERIPNQFDLTLVAAKRGHVDRSVLDEVDLPAVQQPKVELEALDPSFDI